METQKGRGLRLMYLRTVKKDFRRKKATNIILLLFICLATMFVSSSMNNIISVTTALDHYLEMADAPDFFIGIANKTLEADIDEVLNSAGSIESHSTEKVLFLSPSNFIFEEESIIAPGGTNMLQSDKDISMNYFLDDGSILKTVSKGQIYMTVRTAEQLGLKAGDKLRIEIEGVIREFTFAGSIRDAILGSGVTSMTRYIISEEDFESYASADGIDPLYGGTLIYINTPDMEATLSEIKPLIDNGSFTMDRAEIKFTYVFDMIVTGILLVVSVILIAVAFLVLRFTIIFTLSEEFREIGVMRAIGIGSLKIRGLYLVKYASLAVIGAVIGLMLSFPFGEMLMSVSSTSVMIDGQNLFFINIICALLVIAVILLFCFGCTGKIKKMTPIDAIRNGQTGERFRKKSLMSLGRSKLGVTPFLALNDIVSSPKRYSIITFTFFLCLSLLLMLSASVSTMKSGTLMNAFGLADCDITVGGGVMEFMTEGGHEKLKNRLDDMEQNLAKNGMSANCMQEMMFNLPVSYGENERTIVIYQGTGTTMDMYEYTEGTAPQAIGEIAMTKISADKLKANIGDTVSIKTVDGDKKFIITAFFQSMLNMGDGIRLYTDEKINYIQAQGGLNTQVIFTDAPDDEEISRRIETIYGLYPDVGEISTCAEAVADMIGVTETLASIKSMVAILTIILAALITVLMERSFIAKEQGEIALVKAIGARNREVCAHHTMRFAIVGIIAVMIGELFAMPLTHLCIDPVFRMMGMELAVDYIIAPVEMYMIFPLVILVTTIVSAFLTSLYTKKVKSSDTANIE